MVNVVQADERLDLVKALANVIKHVPAVTPGDSVNQLKLLETFCLPIAQRLHQIASTASPGVALDKVVVSETCGNIVTDH